ncbi:transposase [Sporolactobacillus vineae]|uniref:transposase n=1 Tax=Sporolactobacillus vineae TaxID=444463 RepID=UPI0002886D8A|nr:transposase [Sporolactobacillus vineae]
MGKHHSREFRESIAKLIVDGHRAAHDVALEKGLPDSTISRWVAAYRAARHTTDVKRTPNREELEKAKAAYIKEMKQIDRENELLKRTMQFLRGQDES